MTRGGKPDPMHRKQKWKTEKGSQSTRGMGEVHAQRVAKTVKKKTTNKKNSTNNTRGVVQLSLVTVPYQTKQRNKQKKNKKRSQKHQRCVVQPAPHKKQSKKKKTKNNT
jgi:hypothetical protein